MAAGPIAPHPLEKSLVRHRPRPIDPDPSADLRQNSTAKIDGNLNVARRYEM